MITIQKVNEENVNLGQNTSFKNSQNPQVLGSPPSLSEPICFNFCFQFILLNNFKKNHSNIAFIMMIIFNYNIIITKRKSALENWHIE